MFAKMKHIFVVLGLLLACWAMQRCANMVAPVGGPKDTQAPMVVKAVPENHTLNFVNKKMELTFDNYVHLENASRIMSIPFRRVRPSIRFALEVSCCQSPI